MEDRILILQKGRGHRKKNDDKVFFLILGQCTDNLRAMFEADARWTASVNDKNDVIRLLQLIQHYMSKQQTHKDPMLALVNQERKPINFKQGDKMNKLEYLQKFKNLVDAVK